VRVEAYLSEKQMTAELRFTTISSVGAKDTFAVAAGSSR
jgi:hypothetical protein